MTLNGHVAAWRVCDLACSLAKRAKAVRFEAYRATRCVAGRDFALTLEVPATAGIFGVSDVHEEGTGEADCISEHLAGAFDPIDHCPMSVLRIRLSQSGTHAHKRDRCCDKSGCEL